MITSLHSRYMNFGYQPARSDKPCVGNTLSHVQAVGISEMDRAEYVIMGFIRAGVQIQK